MIYVMLAPCLSRWSICPRRTDSGENIWRMRQSHGLRRTNADKRRAVDAALRHPNAAKMSNVQIAEHCGVGEALVRHMRGSIVVLNDDTSSAPIERTVTRNGTTYVLHVPETNHRSEPEPEPAPAPEAKRTQSTQISPHARVAGKRGALRVIPV